MAAFQQLEPQPALRPFVDRFWARWSEADPHEEPQAERILPDGCIDLMVNLGAGGRAVVVGTMTRALVFVPRAPLQVVAVRFRPGGAVPFLGVSARELTDRLVDGALLGVRWLDPAALAAGDALGAVRRLEGLLLGRLRAVVPPDPLAARAAAVLLRPSAPPVEALARELGCTRQHLGRTLRHHVGVGPKRLARVARVQRAVDLVQRCAGTPLAEAAVRLGYFDEAHMDREFRELVGVPPGVARVATGSILPMRSLLQDVSSGR